MEKRHLDLLGRYTTKEAAQRVGFCTQTIKKYIRNGEIPGCEVLPTGRYLIRKEPFDAWVRRGEHIEEGEAAA